MTLDDFNSKVRDYRRFELLRGVLFCCLLLSLAFPTLFVGKRIDRAGFDGMAVTVISASYGAIAALMFYVLAPMRRKHLRKLHGECPTCGRLLLGSYSGKVIDTGRCPNCKSQVLA